MRSLLKVLVLTTILFSFILIQPMTAQEKEKGKIKNVEKTTVKKSGNRQKKSSNHEKNDNQGGKTFFEEFILKPIYEQLLVFMFIGPPGEYSLLCNKTLLNSYYSDYPYVSPDVGLYLKTSNKRYAVSLWGNYFYNNSRLQGIGFRSRFSPLPFLGLELRFTDLTEKLHTKDDHLQLYDVLINYHRIRSERWALWWGVGMKGIEGNKTHKGLALNLGTEIYPKKPISLHLDYNVGIFSDHSIDELLLQLNWHINRNIIYIGYQRFSTDSAVLDGAIVGIGIYL